MATLDPKAQLEQGITAATAKGSQRITIWAMVDRDSYVQFNVPEWVIALNKAAWESYNQQPTDKKWKKKPYTKTVKRDDESIDVATTGTTARNVRPQAEGGTVEGKMRIYKQVQLIFNPTTMTQQRGDKKYKSRSIRVHPAMNSRAIQYFLENSPFKQYVNFFTTGRTRYPVGVNIDLNSLGSLADSEGATTSA